MLSSSASSYLLLAVAFSLISFVSTTNEDPSSAGTGNFTIINGQIFTPGLVVVDAPQPFTPLGGDFLQVALDITGSGRLAWPDNPSNSPTIIHNITLFLASYITGYNFTISNASSTDNNNSISPPLTSILLQEPSSTVKHVNWLYPSCLVGNGNSKDNDNDKPEENPSTSSSSSPRGPYNISLHQSYRLNNTDYYTIFNLPIDITNEIPFNPSFSSSSSNSITNNPAPGPSSSSPTPTTRLPCPLLQNPLLDPSIIDESIHMPPSQPYLGGDVVVSGSSGVTGGNTGNNAGNGVSGIDSVSSSTSSAAAVSVWAERGWGYARLVGWFLMLSLVINAVW